MKPRRHTLCFQSLISALLLACVLPPLAIAQDRRGPFTHAPRSVRSRDVDQRHVRLELAFDWDDQKMSGRALLTLAPYKPIKTVELDAAEMQIAKVALVEQDSERTERELKFSTTKAALNIQLDREYDLGEDFVLAIDYSVTRPRRGAHFVVPDPNEPQQHNMVWTQGEPQYVHYWIPCIDSPSDRITSEIIATVPEQYFVLSNGTLIDKQDTGDGRQTWHWRQQKSHVPYLMSIVAGEFDAYEQSWGGIPVVSYVPKGRLEEAPRCFEKTPAMMAFFSEKIGVRYPWPKYAQICVDEYNWGGMEHTSATTLNTSTLHDERAHLDYSSDNLVAHELAHQWFGDLMTCKDWGEIWMNESFATYFATLWMEHDQGWDEACWKRHLEAEAYKREDRRYRRSIVNYRYNTPDAVFDQHAYPKGGRVLHALRFLLGDELFWKSINRYAAVNQHRNVETADLRIAIEDATGQGLNWFFDQWVYKGGHPEFTVDWSYDTTAKSVRVNVKQTQKVDDVTPLFRTPVEIEIATPSETIIRRVEVSQADETFHFDCSERPTRVCFDPRDWILKTLKFEKPKEELLDQLAHDEHLICRARAAEALGEFKKDEDVQAALIQAAKSDAFWAVRQQAVEALARFSGDDVRKSLIEIADDDKKSDVRREAIQALGAFKHDESRQVLRQAIANDPSYYAVADAIAALVKVDRDNCVEDLLAQLDSHSHNELVLSAACRGLAELKARKEATPLLTRQLEEKISDERRVVITAALARLVDDDPQYVDALKKQLANGRRHVRSAAVQSLLALNDPAHIDVLLERRAEEASLGVVNAIDEAIEKLRAKEQNIEQLRKEIESLKAQNQRLEERLKKLEKTAEKP